MNEQLNSAITSIMRKMCEFVNADFDNIDFKSDDWYNTHTWTEQQEQEFIAWLKKHLKDITKNDWYELTHFSRNKRNIDSLANEITWNYGWLRKNKI